MLRTLIVLASALIVNLSVSGSAGKGDVTQETAGGAVALLSTETASQVCLDPIDATDDGVDDLIPDDHVIAYIASGAKLAECNGGYWDSGQTMHGAPIYVNANNVTINFSGINGFWHMSEPGGGSEAVKYNAYDGIIGTWEPVGNDAPAPIVKIGP